MAEISPEDEEVQLRHRARRRLIGAVVLVIGMVVLLPPILDRQGGKVGLDIPVGVPPRGVNAAAPTVAAPAPGAPAEPVLVAPSPAPAAPAEGVRLTAPEPGAATPAPNDARPVDKPADGKPAESHVTAKPAEAKAPDAPEAPTHPDPGKVARLQVRPSPATKPDAAPKAGARGVDDGDDDAGAKPPRKPETAVHRDGFVVQVGVFADAAKARQLQARLSQNGIRSFSEVVRSDSGARTRIRVGPFTTREDAERMHARIALLGEAGMVVRQ